MRAPALVFVATLLVAAGCGVRDELFTVPLRAPRDAGVPAKGGSGGTRSAEVDASGAPRAGAAGRSTTDAAPDSAAEVDATSMRHADADASTPSDGAKPDAQVEPLLDAATDAADVDAADAALDAAPDSPSYPDCSCPPDDYVVNLMLGSETIPLTAPLEFGIYCHETAPQLAHQPCGTIYRLSACFGPGSAPPCVYVAVDEGRGPLLGDLVDETGQTWELVNGDITVEETAGRAAIGSFSATFRIRNRTEERDVSGTFRACMPLFAPC